MEKLLLDGLMAIGITMVVVGCFAFLGKLMAFGVQEIILENK